MENAHPSFDFAYDFRYNGEYKAKYKVAYFCNLIARRFCGGRTG
jgi:hypothetical protein